MVSPRTLVAVLALVLFAGCGSEQPSDADRVRSTVQDYVRLQAEGDTGQACGLLSPAGRAQLTAFVSAKTESTPLAQPHMTCQRAIEIARLVAGTGVLEELRAAEVKNVAVSGDGATADLVGTGDVGRRTVRLVRAGDGWRIDAVPGLP